MQNVATQAQGSSAAGHVLAEQSLVHFTSAATPENAVAAMTLSAANGDMSWESAIGKNLAAEVASNGPLCMKFLSSLSKQPALPHAAQVLNQFLSLLTPQAITVIFDETALRRRSHPAITCFYNASFASPTGISITRVLEVYVRHGLPLASVVKKNMCDVERATLFAHRSFLKLIVPLLPELPDEVIKTALCKSLCPMECISILIDDCGIPLLKLATPRLLAMAQPEARSYLHARHTRMYPIPETILTENDTATSAH